MYKTNIMKILAYFFIVLSLVVMPLQNTYAQSDKSKNIYQNQINWLLDRFKYQDIRGGTTKGLDVVLDTIPSENFMKLQDENLEKKNKDQLAILSMVGEYRVGFEFLETFGSKENYKLDKPYQSWGTEMVIVVKNEPNFISLQHVMMMYFKDDEGNISGPYIQKHWRQDWKYEDNKILNYRKNKIWESDQVDNIKNTWSQTVYQVDDSPRYESFGKWIHSESASRWVSQSTPRPLPRREFSVRDDYGLLLGLNKITVMSWGWVMEEVNEKIITPNKFLGSEYGIARYQRISNYDFKPAYDYWNKTKDYWSIVRNKWTEVLLNKKVCLLKDVEGKPLYLYKFDYAEDYKNDPNDKQALRNVNTIVARFLDNDC
tara:strand:- start:1079 stop:2194 length:1116 start_codon:yes stop_codon:yes gene_type:complete